MTLLECNPKSELIFIRHFPTNYDDRLYGKTDIDANLDSNLKLSLIRNGLKNIKMFYSSPAVRCLQTFNAIWPDRKVIEDSRLWEQNFGDWEGLSFSQIPDIGFLDNRKLADYVIPNGESFNQLCKRCQPALLEISRKALLKSCIVITHAGIIRSAIGLALNANFLALKFEIDYFSITRIRVLENGYFSIISANLDLYKLCHDR